MTNQELSLAFQDINNIAATNDINSLEKKYASNNHPEIDYYIGVKAINAAYTDIGKKRLIRCASNGVKPPYLYFDTIHSNAVGQSRA